MKKLFNLTGVFVGVYLIYVFLLYSSSLIFPANIGELYDCTVDSNICAEELTEVAQKYNVTTFTTEYNNTSYFDKDVVFSFLNINSEDNIKLGYQEKLISTNKILYEENGNSDLKLQRFWAVKSSNSDFDAYLNELKGYGVQKERFESHKMDATTIFAPRNVEFFFCIVLLLIFCVGVYYMLRSKEIAILKLNGYKDFAISSSVLKIALKRVLISYSVICAFFCVYLIWKSPDLFLDFAKLYLYIALCILAVMLASVLVGTLFVKFLDIIPALKNNKNNKLLIGLIATFKVLATFILMVSINNVYHGYLSMKVVEAGCENLKDFNPCYIKTSEQPDDSLMAELLTIIDRVDDEKIYNYSEPTECLIGSDVILNNDAKNEMYMNPPFVRMSYSMLPYVSIYSDNGVLLSSNDFDTEKTTLLIPENLAANTEEIVSMFAERDMKVKYVASNQGYYNLLNPLNKSWNVIYILKPVERGIYFNGGRVLFDEGVINEVNTYLTEAGIDRGTVSLVKLSSDYEKVVDSTHLRMMDDLQFLVVNALSFLLAVVAISVTFCEFRKKEIAVYKTLAVFPIRSLLYLCFGNILITFIVSLFMQPLFCLIFVPECIIYGAVFYRYWSKKAVPSLKGE